MTTRFLSRKDFVALRNCLSPQGGSEKLIERDKERSEIRSLLKASKNNKSGDGNLIYLYGVNGTGKSSLIEECVSEVCDPSTNIFLNGANFEDVYELIKTFHKRLPLEKNYKSLESGLREIERFFSHDVFQKKSLSSKHWILVIDEFDSLHDVSLCTTARTIECDLSYNSLRSSSETRRIQRVEKVITALLDCASVKRSHLTIVLIANRLRPPDFLTERARSRSGQNHIRFPPYTFESLQRILYIKLGKNRNLFFRCFTPPDAHQYAIRVSANAGGDCRRLFLVGVTCLSKAEQWNRPLTLNEVVTFTRRVCDFGITAMVRSLPLNLIYMVSAISKLLNQQDAGAENVVTFQQIMDSLATTDNRINEWECWQNFQKLLETKLFEIVGDMSHRKCAVHILDSKGILEHHIKPVIDELEQQNF